MSDRYGGFALGHGDDDAKQVWGGAKQTNVALKGSVGGGAGSDALRAPHFVRTLQQDLRELGFWLVKKTGKTFSGTFDRWTELAVREFQIYAKEQTVAREQALEDTPEKKHRYRERLKAVSNWMRYDGPVSGVLNEKTRVALFAWLLFGYRCPVVLEAWRCAWDKKTLSWELDKPYQKSHAYGKDAGKANGGNLWHPVDDLTKTSKFGIVVFAHDLRRPPPAGRGWGPDDALVVVGYRNRTGSRSGPRSVGPWHSWPEAELTPTNLFGTADAAAISASRTATLKVVRAMSNEENGGYLDSLNASDNAFQSVGPFHGTIGIQSGGVVTYGELVGALATLKSKDGDMFRELFESRGVSVEPFEVIRTTHKRILRGYVALETDEPLVFRSARRNTKFNEKKGLDPVTAYQVTDAQGDNAVTVNLPQKLRGDADRVQCMWFQTWHWYYRFQTFARTSKPYYQAWWEVARARLRDVLESDWGAQPAFYVTQPGGAKTPACIGDVFSSELAAIYLLRIHARGSGYLLQKLPKTKIPNGPDPIPDVDARSGPTLLLRTAASVLKGKLNTSEWGDAEETKLLDALAAGFKTHKKLKKKTVKTLELEHWPKGHLRSMRDADRAWFVAAGEPSQKRSSFYPQGLYGAPGHAEELPARVFPAPLRDL